MRLFPFFSKYHLTWASHTVIGWKKINTCKATHPVSWTEGWHPEASRVETWGHLWYNAIQHPEADTPKLYPQELFRPPEPSRAGPCLRELLFRCLPRILVHLIIGVGKDLFDSFFPFSSVSNSRTCQGPLQALKPCLTRLRWGSAMTHCLEELKVEPVPPACLLIRLRI